MATEPTCLPSTATGTGDSLWHTQKMTYPQANKPTQLTWPWIHKWHTYHGHGYTSSISTMAMDTQVAYLPWPWIHKWHIYHGHGYTSGISTMAMDTQVAYLPWPWIHKWHIYRTSPTQRADNRHSHSPGISTMAMATQVAYLPNQSNSEGWQQTSP